MVTENVVIKISERGARATASGITRVGSASRKATFAVTALLGALSGFLAVRGLIRVSKGAIEAAASFEQFGIRIGALLGSQKEANIALENFTTLASKTPFAVSQIVEGASALGAAALGNREALETLTQTAANLAAVTGLSFRDAAGNLQRALSAGIGAADLFRERGVRALIESIKGIPDATKLTKEELDEAFADVFGAGGIFGRAAEALSNTLGGALSNIGDAATNTRVALGQAFAPSVINAARQAIIPFLEGLKDTIEENDQEIREFAAAVIKFAIPAVTGLVRAAFALAASFVQVRTFAKTLSGAFKEFQLDQLSQSLQLFQDQVAAGTRAADDPALLAVAAKVAALRPEVDGLANALRLETEENDKFLAGLDAAAAKLGELDALVEGIDFTKTIGSAEIDIELPTGGPAVAQTEDQIAALKKVEQITNRLRISSAGRVSQEERALEQLEQQRVQLVEAAIASGDETVARRGLLEIEAQIRDIRETQREELEKGILTGRQVVDRVGDIIGTRLGEGVRNAFLGEGIDAMNILANIGGDLVQQSLNDAVSAIGETVSEIFSQLGGEFSGAFGSAIAGAIGVGIGILARELSGGSATARNDLVQSAVQSTQATRGVVAGPTSIPVFQVGQQLNAALTDTNSILDRILAAILTSPSEGGLGSSVTAGSASADLALTTPSLV